MVSSLPQSWYEDVGVLEAEQACEDCQRLWRLGRASEIGKEA